MADSSPESLRATSDSPASPSPSPEASTPRRRERVVTSCRCIRCVSIYAALRVVDTSPSCAAAQEFAARLFLKGVLVEIPCCEGNPPWDATRELYLYLMRSYHILGCHLSREVYEESKPLLRMAETLLFIMDHKIIGEIVTRYSRRIL